MIFGFQWDFIFLQCFKTLKTNYGISKYFPSLQEKALNSTTQDAITIRKCMIYPLPKVKFMVNTNHVIRVRYDIFVLKIMESSKEI